MAKNTDVTTSENVMGAIEYRDGLIDFAKLTEAAAVVSGGELYSGDRKVELVGVPFAITRITFHPGFVREETQSDFVTAEAWIADEATLAARHVDMRHRDVKPRTQVFINDGSTGIRRQLVAFLVARGAVTLASPIVEAGTLGESSYDAPIAQWEKVNDGDIRFDEEGNSTYTYTIEGTIFCPRGLRQSSYTSKHTGKDAATYYIA